ncbi:MAG: hypothetical protein H7A09_03285 [Oceanospirillaceae bacterium]|nr:hypothetical protein [Oceanospirillaceae bacterium]
MLRAGLCVAMCCFLAACGGGGGGAAGGASTNSSGSDACLPAAVAESGACLTDAEFFTNKAWPVLNTCTSCHTSSGAAKSSAFILGNSSNSFAKTQSYFASHGSTLLKKPSRSCNTPHGGGTVFSTSSSDFQTLQQLTVRFTNPVSSCAGGNSGGNSSGSINSEALKTRLSHGAGADLLRKASLHLSGTLSDSASLAAAASASEQNLRSLLRNALSGEGFKNFLLEGANDQLLTLKFAGDRAPAYDQLSGWFYYSAFDTALNDLRDAVNNSSGAEQAQLQNQLSDLWNGTNRGLAEEPLQLIAYVAENERPYTEILTAEYIMVNPYTNDLLQAGASFDNTDDASVWKAGSQNHATYLNQDLPVAGILTSPMFLARYPSTDTNRNRAGSLDGVFFPGHRY